jgi:hypothetical protein
VVLVFCTTGAADFPSLYGAASVEEDVLALQATMDRVSDRLEDDEDDDDAIGARGFADEEPGVVFTRQSMREDLSSSFFACMTDRGFSTHSRLATALAPDSPVERLRSSK